MSFTDGAWPAPGTMELITAMRISAAEVTQVAAELQEPSAGLAQLDVPVELDLAQLVSGEQLLRN